MQIAVKDFGQGIPTTLLSKIFDPFFTTKALHKGMGLGLSSTKNFIEKDFKGTITVKSVEHKGTTFLITIPF